MNSVSIIKRKKYAAINYNKKKKNYELITFKNTLF